MHGASLELSTRLALSPFGRAQIVLIAAVISLFVVYRNDIPLQNRQLTTGDRDQTRDQRVHRHIVEACDYDGDALMRRGDLEGRRRRRVVRVPSFHRQSARTAGYQIGNRGETPAEDRRSAEALVDRVMEEALPRIGH